jgi:hypothetical protein
VVATSLRFALSPPLRATAARTDAGTLKKQQCMLAGRKSGGGSVFVEDFLVSELATFSYGGNGIGEPAEEESFTSTVPWRGVSPVLGRGC